MVNKYSVLVAASALLYAAAPAVANPESGADLSEINEYAARDLAELFDVLAARDAE